MPIANPPNGPLELTANMAALLMARSADDRYGPARDFDSESSTGRDIPPMVLGAEPPMDAAELLR